MIANLTIPALKTLISDMNLRSTNGDMTVPAKARKSEIVTMIEQEIDRLWDEALMWDANREIVKLAQVQAYLDWADAPSIAELDEAYRAYLPTSVQHKRASTYITQRGTHKLTAAQWRRIRKNNRKYGLITGIRNDRSVSVTIA